MNDTEKLSQQLYDKALNEMNVFLDDLKTKPPEEIIESAYKITVRQDLMMILESEDFSPYEIEVLANLDHPLQVLYEQWVSMEDHHMEDLRNSMQSYFDTVQQYQANKLYADPATPRYEGLYREAKEKVRSTSTVQAEIGTGRVSTPLLNISVTRMRTGECGSLYRSGHRNSDMTAVNFFSDTRCSAPTGTDGTLPQPSAKPPSLITVSQTSATHSRSFTPMLTRVW